ncbi:caspase family protein [Niveispirillum sp. KHB5.9]|uniref:caspase family protein n=1 Tax=Niveispirillum sp. KHB5.9 TaxID=3400269 RepID=UPI003A85304A
MDQALVIGIGRYPQLGGTANTPRHLPGAIADALDVAKWLTAAGVNVTLVTSDGRPGEVWQVDALRPHSMDIADAYRRYNGSDPTNRLYIYAAGHGIAPKATSRSLIMADACPPFWLPNVELPEIVNWFANQGWFGELVLWMDCCAVQALEYSSIGNAGLPNTAAATTPSRMFMAFASGNGRAAYEGPVGPDGNVRGLFTQRLLRGLRGAAADQTGAVTSQSLANFLRNGGTEGPGITDAVVPLSDPMLFATSAHPSFSIRAVGDDGQAWPDGTPVSLSVPPAPPLGGAAVAGGRVTFTLGVGLYRLSTPTGSRRLIEISAATLAEIE